MKKLLKIFIMILPLVISYSTPDPVLSIRVLVLSIFSFILLSLSIFKKDNNISFNLFKSPFSIVYLVLCVVYLFSSYINGFSSESINIILRLFQFYIFFLIVSDIIVKNGFNFIFKPILYFSLIISVLYFVQVIDFYFNLFGLNVDQTNLEFNKLASTMTNRNLMVSVQFLCLPFIIYLFYTSNKMYKMLSVISVSLFVLALILTQTRAVLLAVIIGIFIMTLFYRKKISKKFIIYSIISLIALITTSYIVLKQTGRYDIMIQKTKQLSNITESGRYKLYKSTMDMISDYPLIGIGAGNWKVEVWKYGLYNNNMGNSFAQRPHNDFLWVFAEGGILAFVSYLLLFLIILKKSYDEFKNSDGNEKILYSLLFSTIIGYLVISFFDFPMERVSHNVIFMIIAAVLFSKINKSKKVVNKVPKFVTLILILLSTYTISFSYNRYQKEIHFKNALQFKDEGKNRLLVNAINEAYDSYYYDIDNTSTPLLWYRGIGYFNMNSFDKAFDDFKAAMDVNPNHVHILNNLATIYEIKGKHKKAKEYYNKALEIIPTFKESRVNLAAILYNEKEYEQALDVILESKVYSGSWIRKEKGGNYDKYLKIIVSSWANSLINNSEEGELRIKNILNSFEENPGFAEKRMREVKEIKDNLNCNYITALIEAYKK